jgi:hypothetical protein
LQKVAIAACLAAGLLSLWPRIEPDSGMVANSIVLAGKQKLANVVPKPQQPVFKTSPQRHALIKAPAPPKSAIPFSLWFGPPGDAVLPPKPVTYRTLCVRLCDGSFFPISNETTRDRFAADETQCQSSCASPARLFVYDPSTGSPETMKDREGRPYTQLATAFQFRTSYDSACTCKPQPWQQEAKDRHQMYALLAAQRKNKGDPKIAVELASLRAKYGAAADKVLGKAVLADNTAKASMRKKKAAQQLAGLAGTAQAAGAIAPPSDWQQKMTLGVPPPQPAVPAPQQTVKRTTSANDIFRNNFGH